MSDIQEAKRYGRWSLTTPNALFSINKRVDNEPPEHLEENPLGPYVLHSDYVSTLARAEKAESELAKLKAK